MRDILDHVRTWRSTFTVATVTRTWRSSPRQPGASMAVDSQGQVVGSVSGGCVEGDLYLRAQDVLTSGEPQLVRYGVSDKDAFTVGLTCGGELEVLIHRVDPSSRQIARLAGVVDRREPALLATVVEGDQAGAQLTLVDGLWDGTTGDPQLDRALAEQAAGLVEKGQNQLIRSDANPRTSSDASAFVECYVPPPRMLIFGAVDFAAALAKLGAFLGYRVTVCDARAVFSTPDRFPEADEVVTAWPHIYLARQKLDARAVICVLTHDPKFDIPVLEEALRTSAAYIGVMGSRRTDDDRRDRLRECGIAEDDIARLSSPIGLDLGACSPEETAVSIGAEIIAARHGGTGRPLSQLRTPIHRQAAHHEVCAPAAAHN